MPIMAAPKTLLRPWSSHDSITSAAAIHKQFVDMDLHHAFGCPNCKDAVNTADPDGLNVARGYFYSILIMLAMPFTLVGSFGLYVWREVQRQKRTVIDAAAMPPDASDGPAVAQSPNAALP